MKRQLFFIILVLISNNLVAQIGFGTTFDFCTLNSSQYNPGYHPKQSTDSIYSDKWVTIYEDDNLSECERFYIQMRFRDDYPGHTILAPPTMSYNCHGYSHSICQGGDTCNVTWYPELISNSFETVQTPQPGDIAVVRDYADPNHTSFTLLSSHSSIVVNQDTLISKWGIGALTKHHKYDVIGFNGLAMGSSVYVYYRRVINNTITGPSTFNGTGVYTFDYDVAPTSCTWSVEPAAMFQTSSGTGYTANLSYATPFTYLAPKATITFTFSYGCDNHYTATKEIDLRIPTTTISGIAVSDSFIIDTNAVVTVTGTVKSRVNAKVVVPEGTRLVLNGGSMTSDGSVMWQGIEVWGNSSNHQQYVNGGYLQGYLERRNRATIENAICAVELWHPNHYNTTGGIIIAQDAIFRNNRKAIHALNYTNFYPTTGGEAPYNAQFRHCGFIIDEDYLETETFYKHVDIANVNGIRFQGCEFSVSPNSNGASPWCMGIGAYSAGFIVDSYCENNNINPCPTNSLYRSTFTGFNNGILSVNEGNRARTFSVQNSDFINNHRGIFAHNTGYATILNNEFNIGCNWECGYGVYAVGVTGFCIEENTFKPVTGSNCVTYGIGIFNSASINDIYLNTFENLTCGNLSVGVNYATLGGLTYTCNDNTGNSVDFCVLKDNGSGGVHSQQGSQAKPAGNTFSGSQYHFYNNGDTQMEYYYNSSGVGETPSPNKIFHVTPISTINTNGCVSHYGNGGVIKSPKEKSALAEVYKTSEDVHERYLAAGDIVRSDLNDSIDNPEELRLWLANMNEIAADRMIVASYIQEGDFKNAFALANAMPDIYQLKGDDLEDHNDYMAIVSLYEKLYNTNRTVREMTDDEKKMVKDIAENGLGTSRLMARGIMMETNDGYIEPYICLDMPGGNVRLEDVNVGIDAEDDNEFEIGLSPIPATTWLTIDYKLPEKQSDAMMTIVNIFGLKIKTAELSGTQGTINVDLSDLAAGVYSYTVRCGDYQKAGRIITK